MPTNSRNSLEQLYAVAENRTSDAFIKNEAKGGKFFPMQLDLWVNEGDWMPLLRGLWSDEEGVRALEWLRGKEHQSLPPLLYEQSIHEFTLKPTVRTACERSIPLIVEATLSLLHQQKLIEKGALIEPRAAEMFESKYLEKLNDLVGRSLQTSLPELMLTSDCGHHILKRVQNVAEKKIFPSENGLSWLMLDPLKQDAILPVSSWEEHKEGVLRSWFDDWTARPSLPFCGSAF